MAISWFKKKRIIHPVQEEFFSEDACNRFRRMILRRTIHNRRRTTSRRIKIEPKLSRFWLESQGRLIPPPVPPAPVPVPVEPCRSLIQSVFRPELHFLYMLVIYWRLIAHTLHLLYPKSMWWLSAAIVIFVDMGEVESALLYMPATVWRRLLF